MELSGKSEFPTRTEIPNQASNGDAVPNTDAYMGLCNSLTYRFEGWRHLVENLIAFFKQLESTSKNNAKEYMKLSKVIVHPYKDANVFEEHGIQDIFAALRDQTAAIASDSEQISIQLPGTIINILELLREDLREHCKKIAAEGTKGVKVVEKQRAETQKYLSLLDRALLPWRASSPPTVNIKNDPFIVDRQVLNCLARQVQEENNHSVAVAQLQEFSFRFEQNLIAKIKDTIKQFEGMMNQTHVKAINHLQEVVRVSEAQTLAGEWTGYAKREPEFIHGSVPPRSVDAIKYPGKNDQPTVPIMAGYLIRKTSFLKKKQRGFYAFTHSGYLYEFKSSDSLQDPEPEFALYIPDCLIGRPSEKKPKFKITGKDATKKIFGARNDYAFRASNNTELMRWWEALNTHIANVNYIQPLSNANGPSAVSESDDDDDDPNDFRPAVERQSSTMNTRMSQPSSAVNTNRSYGSEQIPSYADSQGNSGANNNFIYNASATGHNAWNV